MIEFLPDTHTYICDGILTPSVTTIISQMYPDTYKGVPKTILERKAKYGDKVHELIESYALGDLPSEIDDMSYEGIALRRYEQLSIQHDISVTAVEEMIYYREANRPIYAGKFDMIGTVGGVPALIDIKTTAQLHMDLIGIQIPLYIYAIENMICMKIEKGYVLHLPKKGLGRLIEIPIPQETEKARLLNRAKKESRKYLERNTGMLSDEDNTQSDTASRSAGDSEPPEV